MLTANEEKQLNEIEAAKQIAKNIKPGYYQRVSGLSNYCGYKSIDGRMWVLGDTFDDIQNPDAIISGKPAREIFGDFTMMVKR